MRDRCRTRAAAVLAVTILAAAPLGALVLDDGACDTSDAWKIGPWDFADDPLGAAVYAITHLGPAMIFDAYYWDAEGEIPGGGDGQAVYEAYREAMAKLVYSNFKNVSGVFQKMANNESQLWAFTEAYWNMQAETQAAYYWSDFADPDRDVLINDLRANSLVYWYNTAAAWNEFAHSFCDCFDRWIEADPDIYGSMKITWTWDGGFWDVDGRWDTKILRYVSPSDQQKVFFSVTPAGSSYHLDGVNTMWVTGPGGRMTSCDTGASKDLSAGANDLSGMESGWYYLSADNTYISQQIAASLADDGASPGVCMLMENDGAWAFVHRSGDRYRIVKDGHASTSSTYGLDVSYNDKNGNRVHLSPGPDEKGKLSDVLDSCDRINAAVLHAFASASDAGLTAWNVYDRLQTSSYLIKPSSITAGSQEDHPLDTASAAVMYIAAMQQLAELGRRATPDNIKISPESLGLVIFGDIYNSGTCIVRDAVFTVFAFSAIDLSTRSQGVKWTVPGMAMVWSTDLDSYGAWDGGTAGARIISIDDCTIFCRNIFRDGVETSEVSLAPRSMSYLGLIGLTPVDPVDPVRVADLAKVMMAVGLLVGGLVAVIGLVSGQRWLLVAGIVMAIVMAVFSKQIAQILVGVLG